MNGRIKVTCEPVEPFVIVSGPFLYSARQYVDGLDEVGSGDSGQIVS